MVWALLAGLLYCSCSPKQPWEVEAIPDGISASTRWMLPQVLIKPGEIPLWFEMEREGPRLIDSPQEASLNPFEPWPLARLITGLLPQENRLIGAVNRIGFLVFMPGEEGALALYVLSDVPGWEPYTAAAPFLYQGTPVVLLYRHDLFADPGEPGAPLDPPDPPVRGLVTGNPKPVGLALPALGDISPAEGWEVNALHWGKDGYWYYRGDKRQGDQPELVYFRSRDLSGPGERSSAGAFRDASAPLPLTEAPFLLGQILKKAFTRGGPGDIPLAAVSSAAFGGIRYFSEVLPQIGDTGELVELAGYYGNADAGGPSAYSYGLVVFPDGEGIYGELREGAVVIGSFTLPALPEQFVYTGVGRSGSALIALWEEQEGLHVGAAGFMVIKAP
ncbi:MAG: hypothetical protein LBT93_01010 [Treponema sp.]|nr:hypothetical protein [Treponema sp.]